jgi:hypothetical protein
VFTKPLSSSGHHLRLHSSRFQASCHISCAVIGLWGDTEWHLILESMEMMIVKCALQDIDGGYKNFEFVIHFI